MELTSRKKMILKHTAKKVNKVVSNTELTPEQVDSELEGIEKSLKALFGADGATEIMDGILESLEEQEAMTQFSGGMMSDLFKDELKDAFKSGLEEGKKKKKGVK